MTRSPVSFFATEQQSTQYTYREFEWRRVDGTLTPEALKKAVPCTVTVLGCINFQEADDMRYDLRMHAVIVKEHVITVGDDGFKLREAVKNTLIGYIVQYDKRGSPIKIICDLDTSTLTADQLRHCLSEYKSGFRYLRNLETWVYTRAYIIADEEAHIEVYKDVFGKEGTIDYEHGVFYVNKPCDHQNTSIEVKKIR